MIVARRLFISGDVQGVGFRMFAHARAARENVRGFVRNLTDGRVEALIEGEADSVARVERALRMGPPPARVTMVDAIDEDPTGRFLGFDIR